MPIKHYRSISDVEPHDVRVSDPVEALRRMCELVSLGSEDRPPLYAPGVYKFRSVEEAAADREARTIQRASEMYVRREQRARAAGDKNATDTEG